MEVVRVECQQRERMRLHEHRAHGIAELAHTHDAEDQEQVASDDFRRHAQNQFTPTIHSAEEQMGDGGGDLCLENK
eukprot:2794041-Prymnesium_polylepis.2